MSARIVAAFVRMDLVRSRTVMLWGGGLTSAGAIGALTLEGGLAVAAAILCGAMVFGTIVFAPLGTLGTEKLLGTLELDRTLPVPTRVPAVARLLAAAVRTLPLLLFLGTVAVFVSRKVAGIPVATLLFAVVALQLLYWSALWIAYGLLARFDFKRLVWAPAALWFAIVFAPKAVTDLLQRVIEERVSPLVMAALADPGQLPTLGLAVIGLAALCFGIGLAFLISGLRRYLPDPLALQGVVEAVPREELTPVGRGVVIAVIRLRLRLLTPQIRREMMIVAAMVAILLAEALEVAALGPLANISRVYLPILAFLMPGSVGMHLMPARQLGTIEGLQQLPFPRRDIALGHLLTVLLLAVPAVVIWSVAQALEGSLPGVERVLRMWSAIGAVAWLMAAFMVWATLRRVVIALLIVVGIPVVLYFGGGWLLPKLGVDLAPQLAALVAYWGKHRDWLRTALTFAGAAAGVVAGLAMFTHGLRTHQPKTIG